MSWEIVLAGLKAAEKAGIRPPPGPLPEWVYANRAWISKRLHGRGISLISEVKSKHGRSNFRCINALQYCLETEIALSEMAMDSLSK